MEDLTRMDETAIELIYGGTTDTIFVIIANVMLVALYVLAPMPTIWRMVKKKSTENFHPYPFMIPMWHCFVLQLYAFSLEPPPQPFHSYCLMYSNHYAFPFVGFYLLTYLQLTSGRNKLIMFSICLILVGSAGTIVYSLSSWLKIYGDLASAYMMVRYRVVIPICVISRIALYMSPLSVIKNVYKTKSVEYLPFWLCMAGFLNALIWVVYAWVSPTFDPYMEMADRIGLLLGAFQLLVFYKFYAKTQNLNSSRLEGLGDQSVKTVHNHGVPFPYISLGYVGKLSQIPHKNYLMVFAVVIGIFMKCWFQVEYEDIYLMGLHPT